MALSLARLRSGHRVHQKETRDRPSCVALRKNHPHLLRDAFCRPSLVVLVMLVVLVWGMGSVSRSQALPQCIDNAWRPSPSLAGLPFQEAHRDRLSGQEPWFAPRMETLTSSVGCQDNFHFCPATPWPCLGLSITRAQNQPNSRTKWTS